jgi:hypothetical protein
MTGSSPKSEVWVDIRVEAELIDQLRNTRLQFQQLSEAARILEFVCLWLTSHWL